MGHYFKMAHLSGGFNRIGHDLIAHQQTKQQKIIIGLNDSKVFAKAFFVHGFFVVDAHTDQSPFRLADSQSTPNFMLCLQRWYSLCLFYRFTLDFQTEPSAIGLGLSPYQRT